MAEIARNIAQFVKTVINIQRFKNLNSYQWHKTVKNPNLKRYEIAFEHQK